MNAGYALLLSEARDQTKALDKLLSRMEQGADRRLDVILALANLQDTIDTLLTTSSEE